MLTWIMQGLLWIACSGLPVWCVRLCMLSKHCYTGSICLFTFVFVDSPYHRGSATSWHILMHTMLFVQYSFFRWAAVATIYLQQAHLANHITRPQKIFLGVCTLVSFSLPLLFLVAFVLYDARGSTGEAPPLDPWLCATVDNSWFICLGLTTKFLPTQPPLQRHHSLEGRQTQLGGEVSVDSELSKIVG